MEKLENGEATQQESMKEKNEFSDLYFRCRSNIPMIIIVHGRGEMHENIPSLTTLSSLWTESL